MIYLLIPIIFVLTISTLKFLPIYIQMMKSQHKEISGNNVWNTAFNTGNYGEFLTFRLLEKIGESNILTNVYLDKKNGGTTEVDLIMVNSKGIFVFESKNYSGWIFGDEKNKNWTQSLKGGRKNKFFNPIMQNKGHVSAVDNYLKNKYKDYFYSYIVFSERCELKKINVASSNVFVLKRNRLSRELKNNISYLPEVFYEQEILDIYQNLKTQTLADNYTKQQHIENIQAKNISNL